MGKGLRRLGVVAGIVSFVFCLAAGIYLFAIRDTDDGFFTALSLYFIGKAFFVGPMLVVTSCGIATDGSAAHPDSTEAG